MKQILGIYNVGNRSIKVIVNTASRDGSFDWEPDIAEMEVGIGFDEWCDCVALMLHETLEAVASDMGLRLMPDMVCGKSSDQFVFLMSHPQFSELLGRASRLLASAIPDMEHVWDNIQDNKEDKACTN